VLLQAITLDAVIAWRIRLLGLLGREVPELMCDLRYNPTCRHHSQLARFQHRPSGPEV
jgi:hypothetical protein